MNCHKCGHRAYQSLTELECSNPGCKHFSFSYSEEIDGWAARAKFHSRRVNAAESPIMLPNQSFALLPHEKYSIASLRASGYHYYGNSDHDWRIAGIYKYTKEFGCVEGPPSQHYPTGVGLYFPSIEIQKQWNKYVDQQKSA